MATTSTAKLQPSAPFPLSSTKRKHPSDADSLIEDGPSNKRQATAANNHNHNHNHNNLNSHTQQQHHNQHQQQQPTNPNPNPKNTNNPSPYQQAYHPLLTLLSPRYDVKPLSVLPSTSIRAHVDRCLAHLGRFSAWDLSVKPGVVILCARAGAANKLVTIAEVVRRRIGESEQKWWQFNVVSESVGVVEEGRRDGEEEEMVVEETVLPDHGEEEGEEEEEDGYFETMDSPSAQQQGTGMMTTVHEQAVNPPRMRYTAYVTVVLSRVPVRELLSVANVAVQTNEGQIDYLRKKKMGLVG
ncbi:hypothetical protein VTJ04DRAFT_9774 [Mycothermus thermophilus]|uniref:uncharacterized protein n=1 Tax=Humicola insolens TaxID=85995 RepID=UPI003744553E